MTSSLGECFCGQCGIYKQNLKRVDVCDQLKVTAALWGRTFTRAVRCVCECVDSWHGELVHVVVVVCCGCGFVCTKASASAYAAVQAGWTRTCWCIGLHTALQRPHANRPPCAHVYGVIWQARWRPALCKRSPSCRQQRHLTGSIWKHQGSSNAYLRCSQAVVACWQLGDKWAGKFRGQVVLRVCVLTRGPFLLVV